MVIKAVTSYQEGIRILLVNAKNKILNCQDSLKTPFSSKSEKYFLNTAIRYFDDKNIDLFIYVGEVSDIDDYHFSKIIKKITNCIKTLGVNQVIFAPCLSLSITPQQQIERIISDVYAFNYRFVVKEDMQELDLSIFADDKKQKSEYDDYILYSKAVGQAQSFAKMLGDTPPNICNPDFLVAESKKIAKKYNLKIDILSGKNIEKAKMGAFWSVAQGAGSNPNLITIHYNNAKRKKSPPVVLVGKGITFDTGGHSLKPSAAMIGMKYDMCGAAACLAALQAVCELNLPINLTIVIPTCENIPGPTASRPDDVVTSLSGKTIEILNTDAEGRLILCDALTYVEQFKPRCVVDIATLTGAVIVALGSHRIGLLSNNDDLATALLSAGEQTNDKAWRLPLAPEYTDMLKSKFADLSNIPTNGAGTAGTVTAAAFLAEFTKSYNWAHLDIAGTASNSGADRGATGKAVALLIKFINNIC